MSPSLARTLALCEKYRVSKLTTDGDSVTVEFFRPAEEQDAKQSASPLKSQNPVDHARAPEVEDAVAALDRAYQLGDEDDERPERDVAAVIAAIEAEKAEKARE